MMHIGLSLSPTWLRGDDWRREDSRVDELFLPDFWVRAARLAEAAHLDFVMKPDALLVDPLTLQFGVGFAAPDPMSIMSVLCGATEHIGLVPTVSTRFSESFDVARQLQTLDRFSRGRAGVNLVTSLGGSSNYPPLSAGANSLATTDTSTTADTCGVSDTTDEYRDAHDYIDHLEALRATFPTSALQADRNSGVFAVPELMGHAAPHGRFVGTGPLSVPSVSDNPLPVLHAGSSTAAVTFAAKHAHAFFAMTNKAEKASALRLQLSQLSTEYQRTPPKLCPGLALNLTSSSHSHESVVHADRPSHVNHWSITGTPETAASEIMRWFEMGAIDGFIALPMGSWESLRLFTTEVVPLLAAQGLFRGSYSGSTLQHHLTEGTP